MSGDQLPSTEGILQQSSNTDSRTCSDLELRVFEPGNNTLDAPDEIVPIEDIESVELTERIGDTKDEGTVTIHNDDGQYSDLLRPGVRFDVAADFGALDPWGDDYWGVGAWGGTELIWTALIRDREFLYISPTRSDLVLSCEDFVSAVLSFRNVFNSWVDADLAGHDDAIVNEIVSDEASGEIRTDRIGEFGGTTTLRADGTNALDLMETVAKRANAVFFARRTFLVFTDLETTTPRYTLDGLDTGPISNREVDTDLVNQIRVDGPTDNQPDDSQEAIDGYASISESDRLWFEVDTRKAAIDRIEIWTRRAGSEESIRVRVQKANDANDGPIAPGDETSDVINRILDPEFLDDDGFTTFILGDHTLPEPRPWVILETDGSAGQDIGVDSTGVPGYISRYAYTVTVQRTDMDSRNEYRRREKRVKATEVGDIRGAQAIAEDYLDHESVPEHDVAFDAFSRRTTTLRVGDSVELDFARENATGEYIVTERDIAIQEGVVDTTLQLQEVDSL